MASEFILSDPGKTLTRNMLRAISLIREGMLALEQARAVYIQARDGDGSDDGHYDFVAALGGYLAGDYATENAAARASFEEIDSLYSKVGTNGETSAVRDAILQCCAKHGI